MNSVKLLPIQVLIIGCGDIGRRLAALLPTTQYKITGLRRSPPASSTHLEYRICDATDAQALEREVSAGYDIILVTMTPGERSDESYRRAYVNTCVGLVAGLRQHQAPRLIIFVSSTSVYAQQDGTWVDEDSLTRPEGYSGIRLLEAEDIIRHSGFAHCILRFSGIYGPGRNRLIEQVRRGRAVLSASYTNRIHSDDCAGILAHIINLKMLDTPLESLYIASDHMPAPMAEVVNWLAMQLKVNTAIFAPHQMESERGNKRCSNQRLLDSGYKFRYCDYRDGYAELLQGLA